MTPEDCHSREILASILAKRPEFGSAGYLAGGPRGLTAAELLEKIHAPNAPGPGPIQTALADRIER